MSLPAGFRNLINDAGAIATRCTFKREIGCIPVHLRRLHACACLDSVSHYRIIPPQLSLTQESRGLGAHTKKERFLRKQEIGPGSSERVIIVKCQVNSEGLSSSNWEQISPDGDIFNTVLSDQSATAGINQIPSLICLLTERSVSAHCFPFKMCFSSPPPSFFLFVVAICRKSGSFYQ